MHVLVGVSAGHAAAPLDGRRAVRTRRLPPDRNEGLAANDGIGRRLGLGLERVVRLAYLDPAEALDARHRSAGLLHDMGRLVGDDPLPVASGRTPDTRPEVDVVPSREGAGTQRPSQHVGLSIAVHPHAGQVGAEGAAELRPGRGIERLASTLAPGEPVAEVGLLPLRDGADAGVADGPLQGERGRERQWTAAGDAEGLRGDSLVALLGRD
jgi:hypothetical protein